MHTFHTPEKGAGSPTLNGHHLPDQPSQGVSSLPACIYSDGPLCAWDTTQTAETLAEHG